MFKKLIKLLEAIRHIIAKPYLLNHVLEDNSLWKEKVEKKYRLEQGFPLVQLQKLLPGFSEKLDVYAFLEGGSLPTDLALLKGLARKTANCNYFEIGTWRGESVANVADCAVQCYTLNLSKKELLSMGLSEQYANLHGFFSKNKSNIIHLEGNTLNFDFAGLNKKFDLIFIDGDHHYDLVKNDTEKIFKHLTHENSIIVWHDYAYNPEKIRYEVMMGILDGTPEKHRKNLYQVSNTLCAIYTNEQLTTETLLTHAIPSKKFSVSIESHNL